MEIQGFIENLKKRSFSLVVENNRLVLKGDKEKLTEKEIDHIREDKKVIDYIRTHKNELVSFILGQPAINRRSDNIESVYKLSALQQAMLFYGLYDNKSGIYTEHLGCDLIGLDTESFLKSWRHLIQQHTILRTSFHYDEFNIPVQCVHRNAELPAQVLDYRNISPAEQVKALEEFRSADRLQGFDFKKAPLMRIALIRLSEDRYHMLLTHHHIIIDGWSLPVLIAGLLKTYETLTAGKKIIPAPEDKYEDYIRYITSRQQNEEEFFWRNYLSGVNEGCFLPFISSAAERNKAAGVYKNAELLLNNKVTKQITSFVQNHRITVNTLVQGVWACVLHYYLSAVKPGQAPVIFGVTVSGRPDDMPGIENKVGLYINTLPVCVALERNQLITDWLLTIQTDQIDCREYQYSSLNDIRKWAGIKGELFDSLLVFENYPVNNLLSVKTNRLKVENVQLSEQTNFPLTIIVSLAGNIRINFNYNSSLLADSEIDRIKEHFKNILLQVITGAAIELRDIDPLGSEERDQLLWEFNSTAIGYPQHDSIIDLFEQQVKKTPVAPAIVFEDKVLTYSELNNRANRLACFLKERIVAKEAFIPVCLDRSFEMVIGILGILKAGAAYVPIDPQYPDERIAYVLKDTAAELIITTSSVSEKLSRIATIPAIELDKEWDAIAKYPVANTARDPLSDRLAYIIYTSGSTGKPKGVMIEHRSLLNRLQWAQDYYRLEENDVVLQKTTFCFDVSVWELLWPLLTGAKMVMAIPGGHKDSGYLQSVIEREVISLLHFVPSMLEVFLQDIKPGQCKSIRKVLCSGEALKKNHVRLFKEKLPHAGLHNLYGPTEAAIDVTYCSFLPPFADIDIVPIGQPVANTQMYIVDKENRLLPVGVTGELCIGGVQLARGYLNLPDLTRQKFTPHPFDNKPGARIYRTGDLARWLPGGKIEYLGRIDEQIKIRGFRIEPGEIEAVARECKLVKQAAINVHGHELNKLLVAYIVPEGIFNKEAIQSFLKSRLPDYMVPSVLIEISHLPLTSNGKIDKKLLPDPFASFNPEQLTVEPRTDTEKRIAIIWKEVLGLKDVRIQHNFFELGGDSINVITVVSRLRKTFEKNISIADVYEEVTIEQQGILIDNLSAHQDRDSELYSATNNELGKLKRSLLAVIPGAGRVEDIYPMSDIQSGMVYASVINPAQAIYHDQMVYPFSQSIDVAVFRKAFTYLVNKHASLRTAFDMDIYPGGVQLVYKDAPVVIDYIEAGTTAGIHSFIQNFLQQQRSLPFDISQAPLWRASLIHHNAGTCFIFQFHHAILDGWSLASFIAELKTNYTSLEKDGMITAPGLLKCSYRDFVIESIIEKKNETNKTFWKKHMSGYKRLDIFSEKYIYQTFNKQYDAGYFNAIKNKAVNDKLSLKGILLGAYLYCMNLLTYENELTIGLVTNTRPVMEDGDKVLGCFLNTIPFRFGMEKGRHTWKTYFEEIEVHLAELKKRERTTLADIAKINGENSSGRNPFFDTLFSFINFHVYDDLLSDPAAGLLQADYSGNELSYEATNISLAFIASTTGNKFNIGFTLTKELKSGKSLEELTGYFDKVLSCYLNRYEDTITNNDLFPAYERNQFFNTLNTTPGDFAINDTIIGLFEKQAIANPANIAVVYKDIKLTYRELNEQANQFAHLLAVKFELHRGDLTGVMMERSEKLPIVLLGILKSGAAYVPIDPTYPEGKIKHIIDDSQIKILVVDTDNSVPDAGSAVKYLALEKHWDLLSRLDKQNPFSEISTNDLAYIIYTSGSTGRSKGCMINHGNLSNYIQWANKYYFEKSTEGNWALVTSISFDLTVTSLYSALTRGCQLYIGSAGNDFAGLLQEAFATSSVDTIKLTPSHLSVLKELNITATSIRCIICGGEPLLREQVKTVGQISDSIRLYNEYGPTETTVGSIVKKIELADETISIGKPIANTEIYLLNKQGDVVPSGVLGEICIGGSGVGEGYLNNESLTAQKFIANPFGKKGTMYRTGDLARWMPNGDLEYSGRLDDQVKIRGYRVEPAEIEMVLGKSPFIKHNAVVTTEDASRNKFLVAYIVPSTDYKKEVIQEYLQQMLPAYMIPSMIIELPALPLTANGKIDKKALPGSNQSRPGNDQYAKPRNKTEEKLAGIWRVLLRLDKIGIHDNFFELGGHSLIIIQMVNKINAVFGNSLISITDLVKNPTIEAIGNIIDTRLIHSSPANPYIIELRSGDEEKAVFIIPGMPGLVEGYMELAQTIPYAGTVYGLQMKGYHENEEPLKSIEEMAAHNVALIRSLARVKEIYLYAHSYGGTVLYEMLRQLQGTGLLINNIVLIDSYQLSENNFDQQTISEIIRTFLSYSDKAPAITTGEIDEVLKKQEQEWASSFYDLISDAGVDIEKKSFQNLWSVCKHSLSASYTCKEKLDYAVHLVSANEEDKMMQLQGRADWSRCFERVNKIVSPADHFSIVRQPYCSAWLNQLITNKNNWV